MIIHTDSGYLLRERAKRYTAAGTGWLSLKSFAGGRALYETSGGGRFAVDNGDLLLLKHGTHYTISIDAPADVASCCVFWRPEAARAVYHALAGGTAALLDDPSSGATVPDFVERTFRGQGKLAARLSQLAAALDGGGIEPALLDEQLHLLFEALLVLHADVRREIAALPHARAATRAELYRRLHLARDYADASFERPLRLAELASVAGMSPNHLLRGFHRLFGLTPLQYLTERRIELARRLLESTDQPVSEVCLAVGFQSFASFSRMFKRRNGHSPSQFRADGKTPGN